MFRIPETVRVAEGPSYVMAAPASEGDDALEIIYDLNYGSGPIGQQIFKIRLTPEDFEQQIAAARTFVLEQEAEQFRAAGLGTHLTYEDILVFGQDGPIENSAAVPRRVRPAQDPGPDRRPVPGRAVHRRLRLRPQVRPRAEPRAGPQAAGAGAGGGAARAA